MTANVVPATAVVPEDLVSTFVPSYNLNYAQPHCAIAAWPVELHLDETSFRFFLSLSWV